MPALRTGSGTVTAASGRAVRFQLAQHAEGELGQRVHRAQRRPARGGHLRGVNRAWRGRAFAPVRHLRRRAARERPLVQQRRVERTGCRRAGRRRPGSVRSMSRALRGCRRSGAPSRAAARAARWLPASPHRRRRRRAGAHQRQPICAPSPAVTSLPRSARRCTALSSACAAAASPVPISAHQRMASLEGRMAEVARREVPALGQIGPARRHLHRAASGATARPRRRGAAASARRGRCPGGRRQRECAFEVHRLQVEQREVPPQVPGKPRCLRPNRAAAVRAASARASAWRPLHLHHVATACVAQGTFASPASACAQRLPPARRGRIPGRRRACPAGRGAARRRSATGSTRARGRGRLRASPR